ncbi:MAG: enoyl-CoA hydratase/isomerase family protein [Chloroflexota bacterium]
MTDYETVIVDRRDSVAIVRLNRVEKHNAISRQMSADLIAVIDELEGDDDVRVLILTGAGDKAFCAGADMAQAALEEGPADWSRDWAAQAAVRLARVKKPLIGQINGYAYGGGAVFALQCDVRICSDDAKFRFVGAVYGLVVGASRLPSLVGPAIAKELIFTARTVDADEALRIGLANHVVPKADLEPTVLKMAQDIAAHSLPALIASKEVIDIASGFRDAAKRENEHNTELRQSDEHKRRFRAAAERVVRD